MNVFVAVSEAVRLADDILREQSIIGKVHIELPEPAWHEFIRGIESELLPNAWNGRDYAYPAKVQGTVTLNYGKGGHTVRLAKPEPVTCTVCRGECIDNQGRNCLRCGGTGEV